jgi:hypothetical protein
MLLQGPSLLGMALLHWAAVDRKTAHRREAAKLPGCDLTLNNHLNGALRDCGVSGHHWRHILQTPIVVDTGAEWCYAVGNIGGCSSNRKEVGR